MNTTPTEPNVVKIEDPFSKTPKPASGFALFNYGFRAFFLLAGVFAVISVPMWMALYTGGLGMNLVASPTLWHGHEMLFGFSAAAIAGFLLTVVPNWTKAKAQRGMVLMVLTGLWILGRVAFWSQGVLPYPLVMVCDVAFLCGLGLTVGRPLINPQHRRQFIFVPILVMFILANVMTHMGVMGYAALGLDWGQRGLVLGVDVIVVLITVMGGRVTPSFTSSAIGHADPNVFVRQNAGLDRAVLWSTWAVLIVGQVFWDTWVLGLTALGCALLHAVRLSGWQSLRIRSMPIVWVLHLAYAWLIVGIALKGFAAFGVFHRADVVHALTIGAIGTYVVGIMSRASLGHTGRQIKAHPAIVAAYGFISLAALLRLSVAFAPVWTQELVLASSVAWSGAFLAFCVIYAPILMRPRIDGRPG